MPARRTHLAAPVVAALVLPSCQHEKLHVDGGEVRGPGYRLDIPDGFTPRPLPSDAEDTRAVMLGGPSRGAAPQSILNSDREPRSAPTDESCQRSAAQTVRARGAAAPEDVRIEDNAVLGPVCRYRVVGDKATVAVRRFHALLDGLTVTCEARDAAQADALCDGYLATARKPTTFD